MHIYSTGYFSSLPRECKKDFAICFNSVYSHVDLLDKFVRGILETRKGLRVETLNVKSTRNSGAQRCLIVKMKIPQ